ncbi:MAG: hypothetical protein L0I37_12040 [Lactococcus lactis]|nr:hypothetical protein [Lactococcus lactis]MDN6011770.1 hypothetical protein [Lactococcus lactis]
MKNRNKIIIGVVSVAILLGLFAQFSGRHNTQKTLENNKWYLVQDDNSYKTQFDKSTMIIETSLQDLSVTYKLEKSGGSEYLIISSSDVKNQKYKLTKKDSGYTAKAVNASAKVESAVGSFQLRERK